MLSAVGRTATTGVLRPIARAAAGSSISSSSCCSQGWTGAKKATPVRTPAVGAVRCMSTEIPGSLDESFEKYTNKPGDEQGKEYTYFLLGGARVIYASFVRTIVMRFVTTMQPSAATVAAATIEVDVGEMPVGKGITTKWRGKPIFIRRRSPTEIAEMDAVDMAELRDPETDADRVEQPEFIAVIGICTHLGCVPAGNAGKYNGWFCPCHGSHYDLSGRIRLGPAPLNMDIPPYKFDGSTIVMG